MGIHIDHISLLVSDLDKAHADWEHILEVQIEQIVGDGSQFGIEIGRAHV